VSVHRTQQRVDVDEDPLISPRQQIDPLAQRDQMLPQYRLELAGMTEGELAQQGSDRRWRIYRAEQCLHSAATERVDIIDTVRARTHPRDQGGQLRCRIDRP